MLCRPCIGTVSLEGWGVVLSWIGGTASRKKWLGGLWGGVARQWGAVGSFGSGVALVVGFVCAWRARALCHLMRIGLN